MQSFDFTTCKTSDNTALLIIGDNDTTAVFLNFLSCSFIKYLILTISVRVYGLKSQAAR